MPDTPSSSPAGSSARIGRALARIALVVGLLCAAVALLAGPAYRVGMSPLGVSLQAIRWSAVGAIGGAVAALVALLLSMMPTAVPRARLAAAVALGINVLVAAPPLVLYLQVQRLPKIHDISTDGNDPPRFVAVLPLRQGARNGVDYPASTADEQRRGYPDIGPLALPLAPPAAFERALQAARAMGWEIVASAPETLRIEATDTTLMFGFKDDVVVRITSQDAGSVVDVRSLSRVGGSDFGTNAKRVRAYLRLLSENAGTP